MPERRPKSEPLAAERLVFFSDAVVAIAMTLLALELPVPSGDNADELLSSARDNNGHYLSFLISFVVIAYSWSQHYHAFRDAERTDGLLRTLNMLWLLTIVLNPFATKLLTSEGGDTVVSHALRFGFYAFLQVVASGSFLAVHRHLQSADLLPDGASERQSVDELRGIGWRSYGVIAGFGLSIPMFFLTKEAWILWIAGPLLVRSRGFLLLRRLHRTATPAPAKPSHRTRGT